VPQNTNILPHSQGEEILSNFKVLSIIDYLPKLTRMVNDQQ